MKILMQCFAIGFFASTSFAQFSANIKSGDILMTRLSNSGLPRIVRAAPDVPDGELLDLGPDILEPVVFAAPTSDGDLYITRGILGGQVYRLDGDTGESEWLFASPGSITNGIAYDEKRDIVFVTVIEPYLGTKIAVYGPDALYFSTTLFTNEQILSGQPNLVDGLTIDGAGNLYFRVRPYAGTLAFLAKIDAETGAIEYISDSFPPELASFGYYDRFVVLPDGTLIFFVFSDSPNAATTITTVYQVSTDGTVKELFDSGSRFPRRGGPKWDDIAAESDDSFLFSFNATNGGQSQYMLCRYRLSTGTFEMVTEFPSGVPGDGSIELMIVVPGAPSAAYPLITEDTGAAATAMSR